MKLQLQAVGISLAIGISLTPTLALAGDHSFLTAPGLAGYVTYDAYLGNADDTVVAGLNTFGSASSFLDSLGNFGFLGGSMSVQGLSPFGPQNQQYFGANVHSSLSMFGEWNNNVGGFFNQPFTQSYVDGSSSVFINGDQSYTTSFQLYDDAFGGNIQFAGTGHYLLLGQDPGTFYGGDELTHFEFVMPYLPSGWVGVAHEIQTYTVLDGPWAGTVGGNTLTFYTSDFRSLPADAPTPLGSPWTTTGWASADGSGTFAQLGGGEPGIVGTATLQGGATASLNLIYVDVSGNLPGSTLTVTGAGTHLTHDPAALGSIVGRGRVEILDGARVDMGSVAVQDLVVSGPGSLLNLECPVGSDCSTMNPGVTNIPGTTTISAGGRIVATGRDSASIGYVGLGNIGAPSTLVVEGAGSEFHIVGTQNGDPAGPTFFGIPVGPMSGVAVEQEDEIRVADGGAITVVNGNTGWSGVALGGQLVSSLFGVASGPNSVRPAALLTITGAGSTVNAGANLSVGERITYDAATQTFVDAGAGGLATLVVEHGGTAIADLVHIGASGTLMGNGGTIVGSVVNEGTIAPGASPGTLDIVGDLALAAGGTLVIEIAGNAPGTLYDVLNVSGQLTLGGTLEIRLLDGFVPGAGDTFDFLNFGSLSGVFDSIVLPDLGNGETLHLVFGPHGITATSAVPLPAAVWLMLPALGLAARRRRAAH